MTGVVVDGDRNGHAVALGQGDGQIEIDEEVLKDFEAAPCSPSAPVWVEASMAMRQVVMESAIGMAMWRVRCRR